MQCNFRYVLFVKLVGMEYEGRSSWICTSPRHLSAQNIHYFLFFDSMAATAPFPQLTCSWAAKSLGCLQSSSPHPCTTDTQKINLLHCANIDFVELEHLWQTESTTRIKMI